MFARGYILLCVGLAFSLDFIYNPYTENHRNDFSLQSWYPNCKFDYYDNYKKKSIVLSRVLENG